MAVQEEQLVATPAKVMQFAARRSDLRLVKQPIYPVYGPGGQVMGEKPGQTVEFRNGLLTIDLAQEETEIAAGRKVSTAELIEGHRRFGDADEGFFKVDVAAPAVSQEEMDRLLTAAVNLDAETLTAIVTAEEAGWQRATILEPARRALTSVEELAKAGQAAAEAGGSFYPPQPKGEGA
jgi:hypothetical protein